MTILSTILILGLFGGFIGWIDPFFHYHAPLKDIAYQLDDSRYQNDGLMRHCEYETLIIGTSMIANFRTTECDRVFNTRSIKVPYYGATFKEINDQLKRALEKNKNITTVIRGLEPGMITRDKDYVNYEGIPYYLYDDNPFNDVEYVFNKDVGILAVETILNTGEGMTMTSFDDYLRWQGQHPFGKEAVLEKTTRPVKGNYIPRMSDEEREMTVENLRQNVIETALDNPEVTFYYFLCPFSIVFWDVEAYQPGRMDWYLGLQRIIIEEILSVPNIRLYGYDDHTDITTDLDNYQDNEHFSADISSKILVWMKEGEGLLTKDNYEAYLGRLQGFYPFYDYDSLYE